MKKVGNVLNPELYTPVGKEVRISNSVEALEFFEEFYPKGGMVLLGNIRFDNEKTPELIVWLYIDNSQDIPQIISTIPVFDVSIEELDHCTILEVTPHENEVFCVWKNCLYCSVVTDKGNICIMKVRMLTLAQEAAQVIKLQSDNEVEDIFPVELYSHSQHKFIGVCWAVTIASNDNMIYWHPICIDEVELISSYSTDDLSDHIINVGETATIGGDTYRLFYTKEDGYVFKKLKAGNDLQQLFKKCLEKKN